MIEKSLFEFVNNLDRERSRDVKTDADRAIEASFGKHAGEKNAYPYFHETNLPVEIKDSQWEVFQDPERLVRSYDFESTREMMYFLDEVILKQESINHHAKITIENKKVTVETYTHDINAVTELDKIIAYFCDEIYEDIRFIDMRMKNDPFNE